MKVARKTSVSATESEVLSMPGGEFEGGFHPDPGNPEGVPLGTASGLEFDESNPWVKIEPFARTPPCGTQPMRSAHAETPTPTRNRDMNPTPDYGKDSTSLSVGCWVENKMRRV
jgi:hypothetical protein